MLPPQGIVLRGPQACPKRHGRIPHPFGVGQGGEDRHERAKGEWVNVVRALFAAFLHPPSWVFVQILSLVGQHQQGPKHAHQYIILKEGPNHEQGAIPRHNAKQELLQIPGSRSSMTS
jgi:hypothetical protein